MSEPLKNKKYESSEMCEDVVSCADVLSAVLWLKKEICAKCEYPDDEYLRHIKCEKVDLAFADVMQEETKTKKQKVSDWLNKSDIPQWECKHCGSLNEPEEDYCECDKEDVVVKE